MITGHIPQSVDAEISDTEVLLRKLLPVGREGLSEVAIDTVFAAAEELLDELERLRRRDRTFRRVESMLRELNQPAPTDGEQMLSEVEPNGGVLGEAAAELASSRERYEADAP